MVVVGFGGGARTGSSSLIVVRRGDGVWCRRRRLGAGRMLVVRIEGVWGAWVRMSVRGLQRLGRRARKRHVLRRPHKLGRCCDRYQRAGMHATAADPLSRIFPPQLPGSSRAPGPPADLPRHLPYIDNILNFSELIRHPAPPPRAHGRRRAAPPTAPKTYTRRANA